MSAEIRLETVYDTIKQNIKLLALIAIIGGIAGAIFSSPMFTPPRYESNAVAYPINLYPYSDESETEQMMQLFDFVEIRDKVIDKFKLYERHDLEPGADGYKYFVNLLYDERVSISPTRYESVSITCQDEDPEIAKAMVEEILFQFNEKQRRITERKHKEYRAIKSEEMGRVQASIDSLEFRLNEIRGGSIVLEMGSQAERLTEGYVRMIEKGSSQSSLDKVRGLMSELGEKGSELELLKELVYGMRIYYSELYKEHNKELSKTKDVMSYAHVIVEPEVADKKSYPVRWLMVLIAMIASTAAGLIFIAARTRFQ